MDTGTGVGDEAMISKCIRQEACGSASGDDWTNAYPVLPETLVEGTAYYLAVGSLPGSNLTTIKKATIEDHGTDIGWKDYYADRPAADI